MSKWKTPVLIWLLHLVSVFSCLAQDAEFYELCPNDSIELQSGVASASYVWSNSSTSESIKIADAGTYFVRIQLLDSQYVKSFRVVEKKPFVVAPLSFVGCSDDPGFSDELSNFCTISTQSEVQFIQEPSYSENGKYELLFNNGCFIDTTEIQIVIDNCECPVEFASAFSPNDDENNEVFKPLFICNRIELDIKEFLIFNRWGNIVYNYHKTDNHPQWDGRYKNVNVSVGVYKYVFIYMDGKAERTIDGTVHLFR